MYNDYLRSILPIPILDIKISQTNNYCYKILTYSKIADESNNTIRQRIKKCKRIKSIDGWYSESDLYKYAVIEFNREEG